jgi:transposase-like protein
MGSIEDALTAIESLEAGEDINYAQIARLYGVERSTLSRRHRGQTTSRKAYSQMQLSLHPQQDLELLRYIKRLTERGLPPTRAVIRNFASQIAQRELGVL